MVADRPGGAESLDDRKAAILRAVVSQFVETAVPVGSGHVAHLPGIDVSSATVRNEMAALESEGFLAQPHTSSGRIPTDKGYRFFVDSLSGPNALGRSEAMQVKQFFDRAHGELEDVLRDTSRLLAGITDHAAVVVDSTAEAATVCSTQLVALGDRHVLMVLVLSNGAVEKFTIEHGPVAAEVVDEASRALHRALAGQPRNRIGGRVIDGPDPAAAALADSALAAAGRGSADEGGRVYVDGASHVAEAFEAVEQVREILHILEHQLIVVRLISDVLDRGLQVAIGAETGVGPLSECSLVLSPINIDGEEAGTIGVLGPTRMNYQQALAAVAVVSNRLGRRLTSG